MQTGDCTFPSAESVLIFAPTGQDSKLIAASLVSESIPSKILCSIESIVAHIKENSAAAILITEEAVPAIGIALLNESLASQEPWSDVPIILLTSGGETTLATLRSMKAFSPTGNFTLLERPFRRITLQSAVQVALRSRRKQHEVRFLLNQQIAATRMRDEFISIASHELKTPLTSLKLQSQLTQRKIARGDQSIYEPEVTQKLVSSMAKQIDRLATLVEDMLDVSRINIGKLVLQLTTFDIAELVQETVERITPQLDAAGCKMYLRSETPVVGCWDRYRIEQILNNVISNAIRYSPGKPIHITVSSFESNATVVIRDEGKGIPHENHEKIFQRFERAVSASDIMSSAPDKGTSFIIVLPKEQSQSLQIDKQTIDSLASKAAS